MWIMATGKNNRAFLWLAMCGSLSHYSDRKG
jgi:hypothetical protein